MSQSNATQIMRPRSSNYWILKGKYVCFQCYKTSFCTKTFYLDLPKIFWAFPTLSHIKVCRILRFSFNFYSVWTQHRGQKMKWSLQDLMLNGHLCLPNQQYLHVACRPFLWACMQLGSPGQVLFSDLGIFSGGNLGDISICLEFLDCCMWDGSRAFVAYE